MADAERERLTRLIGDPELAWVVARVRRRLEREQPLRGVVTLPRASLAQRRATERLLGRRPGGGGSLSVSLDDLDDLVRRSGASPEGLEAAVVSLTGPVSIRAERRAAEQLAWEEALAPLRDSAETRPELAGWLEGVIRAGLIKRLEPDPAKARTLLEVLARVLAALPADGEPLGRFAAHHAGGAHALDDGRPLATLALGAARALAELGPVRPEESPAESRREAWAAVGVLCDELSSVALTLGLPGDERTGTGRILAVARETGQPVWLTLRQLVRDPPLWGDASGGQLSRLAVRTCENPAIVAMAADRLGADCPPLVCTNGQPKAATMVLLRRLAAAGAPLWHHGDFDWGGVRIGNFLHARLAMRPWRFDAEAYERAVAGLDAGLPGLDGDAVAACWDPGLGEAMGRVGRRVEEELVAEELLEDLAATQTSHRS